MKHSISPEHRKYFMTQGVIEFEEMISSEKASDLLKLMPSAPKRDLWRSQEEVKRFALRKNWAQLVSDLTEVPRVRLAFDQFFPITSPISEKKLTDISCIEGLLAALIIHLDEGETSGNGTFILPDQTISLKEGNYYVIAYCYKDATYTYNPDDPFTYELKHMGYIYGSELTDRTNPTVFSA